VGGCLTKLSCELQPAGTRRGPRDQGNGGGENDGDSTQPSTWEAAKGAAGMHG